MVSRTWFGVGQFPGLRRFTFGTVVADTHEEAIAKLTKAWSSIVPCSPPHIVPVPGQIVIRPDDVEGFNNLIRESDSEQGIPT